MTNLTDTHHQHSSYKSKRRSALMIVWKSHIFVGTTLPGTATGAAGIIDSFRVLLKKMPARWAHESRSDNGTARHGTATRTFHVLSQSTPFLTPAHQVKNDALVSWTAQFSISRKALASFFFRLSLPTTILMATSKLVGCSCLRGKAPFVCLAFGPNLTLANSDSWAETRLFPLVGKNRG